MTRRVSLNVGFHLGLLLSLIESVFCCIEDCPRSTESIALSAILCLAAICAIICPLICMLGPFKKLATIWRKYLHDNLGWEYPERSPNRQNRLNVESVGNSDLPPEYVNIAFIDLPPAYDEVVKNSQCYKYGPASSPVPDSENHHQQLPDHSRHPQSIQCVR